MQDVKTWMTRPPLAIGAEASALEAIEQMIEAGLRHLPVVTPTEDLVGILSVDDLRAALPFEVTLRSSPSAQDRVTAREYHVGELMTYDPRVIDPDAPLNRAVRELVQHHIGCLPVVDAKGKLVGMFTESDALWALASLLEEPIQARRHQDLEDLVRALRSERTRISRRLGLAQAAERERTAEAEEPMDLADLGTQRAEIELTGTLADLAAQRLDEIDRALDRSARGQLDRCADCGREIALGRLRAMPGTDRCLACASSEARE